MSVIRQFLLYLWQLDAIPLNQALPMIISEDDLNVFPDEPLPGRLLNLDEEIPVL